ncbi:hypothetical protein [Treponema denticola]|uniref:hypothetical protein n=1 Tax=Treponema denticola TaxID=158 RepID=UPI0006775DEE|nr:hypothetical protein [Treponema denticola]
MSQKLELTWYGKDKPIKPEPRILIKDDKNSNLGKDGTAENMISQFEYNSCRPCPARRLYL